MSIIRTTPISCPACGGEAAFQLVHSVNADRRPDLRDEILDNGFQVHTCTGCGLAFRVEPEFNYLDLGRRQWIAAWPRAAMSGWSDFTARSRQSFDAAFGSDAPAGARALGEGLQRRATFGWAALREKVFIAGAGLDDVTVELAKMALIRDARTPPLMSAALRLLAVDGDELVFGWQDNGDEHLVELNRVNKALIQEIEADEEWSELRQRLSADLFVDVQRLFMAPVAQLPA